MLFFEYDFLFLFLPATLLLYYRCPAGLRNGTLLLASALFYAASSLEFLPILATSIVVDYFAGRRISASERPGVRKAWLTVSLTVNLGLLGYFKYVGLVTEGLNQVFGSRVPILAAALPVGISFYTFQSMSYTIDIYRGAVKPVRSFTDFATFVSMFPQLIAGPIVRFSDVAEQLVHRKHQPSRFATGISLFVVGLGKKVLVADTLALLAEPIFEAGDPSFLAAWAAMFLYAGQIYFDFSGYSDMAIGLGRMFGFEFPVNFRAPYRASSFADFWRRWHISLSTWLRDYLYIPLGGNRRGPARTMVNLLITMMLGGLWHGASWNFLLWGVLHGLYLAVERALGSRNPLLRLPVFGRVLVTFLAVTVAWVPFRIETFAGAQSWLAAMLLGSGGLGEIEPVLAIAVLGFLALAWIPKPSAEWELRPTALQLPLVSALLIIALFVGYGRLESSPFLYFRF